MTPIADSCFADEQLGFAARIEQPIRSVPHRALMVVNYLPGGHQHDQHTQNPGRHHFNAVEQLLAIRAEVDATLIPILYQQLGAMRTKTTHGIRY
jgi:hypothetical protein